MSYVLYPNMIISLKLCLLSSETERGRQNLPYIKIFLLTKTQIILIAWE